MGPLLLEKLESAPMSEQDGAALAELRARLGSNVRLGERLDRHTSYRIGGSADLFLPASRTDQVVAALQAAHALGVPCRIIGGASNLLVADAGVAGLVVKNLVNETRYAEVPGDDQRVNLVAAAGCQLAAVARQARGEGSRDWSGRAMCRAPSVRRS